LASLFVEAIPPEASAAAAARLKCADGRDGIVEPAIASHDVIIDPAVARRRPHA